MRRKKPMRRSRLARAPMKQGQEPLKRKKALTAKKGLAAGSKPLRARARPAMTVVEREAAAEWHRKGLARCVRTKEGFLVCPVCGGKFRESQMQVHHVIRKEAIKAYVRSLRLPADEARRLRASLLWDHRNALPVSERCHERHTKAVKRIPRALLDAKHLQFAREIGLDYMIDREYE